MFVHTVIFKVKPPIVPIYRKDSKMWAGYAKKARGFIAYFTMKLHHAKHQYASIYVWKTQRDHHRFMQKFHDWLEGKSRARVKVLGYYQFKAIDRVR